MMDKREDIIWDPFTNYLQYLKVTKTCNNKMCMRYKNAVWATSKMAIFSQTQQTCLCQLTANVIALVLASTSACVRE